MLYGFVCYGGYDGNVFDRQTESLFYADALNALSTFVRGDVFVEKEETAIFLR